MAPRPSLVAAAALVIATAASAQPLPPPAIRDFPSEPSVPPPPVAPAPVVPPPVVVAPQTVTLSAVISGDPKPIRSGLVWRIYLDRGGEQPPDLRLKLAAPTPSTTLEPGTYVVHVGYGLASAAKRITVASAAVNERLVLDAGGLRLGGAIGDIPIPPERLAFSVFQPLQNDSEGRLVAQGVKAGDVVRLPEGSYHVVSTYGESNAIMRADLKVERGRITEATLNHRAATVTLKLVANAGGESFAGTAFSILTPGGDVVREAIGAFPTVVLAEGDYTLIARNNGKVFTREFHVESGMNADVEVMVGSG